MSLCGIQSQVGCVLVDMDSGQVEPGQKQFGGRTFKTAFTTCLHPENVKTAKPNEALFCVAQACDHKKGFFNDSR